MRFRNANSNSTRSETWLKSWWTWTEVGLRNPPKRKSPNQSRPNHGVGKIHLPKMKTMMIHLPKKNGLKNENETNSRTMMMKPSPPCTLTVKLEDNNNNKKHLPPSREGPLNPFEKTLSTLEEACEELRCTQIATLSIREENVPCEGIPTTPVAACVEALAMMPLWSADSLWRRSVQASSLSHVKLNSMMKKRKTLSLMTPTASPTTMLDQLDQDRLLPRHLDALLSLDSDRGVATLEDRDKLRLARRSKPVAVVAAAVVVVEPMPAPAIPDPREAMVVRAMAATCLVKLTCPEMNWRMSLTPMSPTIPPMSRTDKLWIPMEKRVSTLANYPRVLACPMAEADWNTKRKEDGTRETGFTVDGPELVASAMEMVTFTKVASRTITNMVKVS
mmetsp:Transcript_31133/g.74845  ORF Transcript_31133/g.74845 Transcript_31133/m.74845 type:complete len:390 (-) Transcript_31133:509-1678(-)